MKLFISILTAKGDISESLQESWYNRYEENNDDNYSLYPEFGKIVGIGLGYGNKTKILLGRETKIIKDFYHILDNTKNIILVGHNLLKYIVPYIIKRGIYHGIKPSKTLADISITKPRLLEHIDLMNKWSFGGISTSLEVISKFLGIQYQDIQEFTETSTIEEFLDSSISYDGYNISEDLKIKIDTEITKQKENKLKKYFETRIWTLMKVYEKIFFDKIDNKENKNENELLKNFK